MPDKSVEELAEEFVKNGYVYPNLDAGLDIIASLKKAFIAGHSSRDGELAKSKLSEGLLNEPIRQAEIDEMIRRLKSWGYDVLKPSEAQELNSKDDRISTLEKDLEIIEAKTIAKDEEIARLKNELAESNRWWNESKDWNKRLSKETMAQEKEITRLRSALELILETHRKLGPNQSDELRRPEIISQIEQALKTTEEGE